MDTLRAAIEKATEIGMQDNSPTENVIAMYETAKKYGKDWRGA